MRCYVFVEDWCQAGLSPAGFQILAQQRFAFHAAQPWRPTRHWKSVRPVQRAAGPAPVTSPLDPLACSGGPCCAARVASPRDSPSCGMTAAETHFPQTWHIYWMFLHVSSAFSALAMAFLQSLAGTWPNKCLFFPIYSENYWALLVSFSFPYERKTHFLKYRRVLDPELDTEMFQEKGSGTSFSQRRGLAGNLCS